jgi:hypothetical protein
MVWFGYIAPLSQLLSGIFSLPTGIYYMSLLLLVEGRREHAAFLKYNYLV